MEMAPGVRRACDKEHGAGTLMGGRQGLAEREVGQVGRDVLNGCKAVLRRLIASSWRSAAEVGAPSSASVSDRRLWWILSAGVTSG